MSTRNFALIALLAAADASASLRSVCTGGVQDYYTRENVGLQVRVWDGKGGPYADPNPGSWTADVIVTRQGHSTNESATFTDLELSHDSDGFVTLADTRVTGVGAFYLYGRRAQPGTVFQGDVMMMAPLQVLDMYYGGTWVKCRSSRSPQ